MKSHTINIWQTGIMLFLLLFANKILLLPSLMFKDTNVEGIFCYVILFVLEILLVTLFIFLKRSYPDKSFSSLIEEKFGKITLKIIYFLFTLFFLFKIVLVYNVTYIFFKDLIYKENNVFLYLICFLPIVNYLAFIGLRVTGRTCQIFFPIILIILLFCVVVSFIGQRSIPLLYQSNFPKLLLATVKHLPAFGDSLFLFIFMDKINYKKGDGKKLFLFCGLAIGIVVAIAISFYLAYTYTSFMHPYAIFEILGNIKDYGGLGRIDVISLILVMFLTYFQIGIYLLCFVQSFRIVLPKLNKIYALISFNFVFLVFVFLLIRNLERTILYAENILPYFSVISFVIVPVCVLIFLISHRRKVKNEET